MIAQNRPSPISNLITTNQVDNDAKNDGNSQYFVTPRKQNHSYTEIHDTSTTTTQVQIKVHPCICQWIPSTPTTSLKLRPPGKEYPCFKIDGKNYRAAPRLYFIFLKFLSYHPNSNMNYRNYGNWQEFLFLWQELPSKGNVEFGFKGTGNSGEPQ